MTSIVSGRRPDVTAAQIGAVIVAGVPAVATLLTAFGVGDLNAAQQDALSGALTWSAILAGLLIGGDAALRAARNLAVARTDAAALSAGAGLVPDDSGLEDPAADYEEDDASPVSDDEEFFAESELHALETAGMPADNPDYVRDGR
jgi:hypothetical protein